MVKFILLTFFISAPLLAKIKKEDPFKILDSISYSKKEIRIASNIKTAFKLAKKNLINRRIFIKLYREINGHQIFSEFRPWAKEVVKIDKASSLKELRKTCSTLSEKSIVGEINKILHQNKMDLCFNKYVKVLTSHTDKDKNFHKSELKFIKFHTRYILTKFNNDQIEFLLKKLRRSPAKLQLYTNTFFNHYIAHSITPSTELVQHMNLLPKHTRYLQKKDISIYNTQYVFYKEFRDLKSTSFKAVDKGEDQKLINESFNKVFDFFVKSHSFLPKYKAERTMLSLCKSYMRRGHYQLARKGFKKLLDLGTVHKDHVSFDYMWSFILEQRYKAALKIVDTYNFSKQFLRENPKINFWLARAYTKLGDAKKAKSIYSSIIQDSPLSFYAILSSKLLGKEIKQEPNDIYLNLTKKFDSFELKTPLLSKVDLKKILIWGKVHQTTFLDSIIDKIKSNDNKQYIEQNLTAASYVLSKDKEYLKSFKIIYRSLNEGSLKLNKIALQTLFPKPYFNQVKYNTQDFDPFIALSLIRQESGFNAHARSHVGARGLMQLMPTTARQLKRRLRTRQLYNPSLNIKLGTKFLAQLMSHYDENLVYSLAAYNAGKRRVDEWQTAYLNRESILENIENIPFRETRKYVKLIFRNMFFYKLLNKKNGADVKDLNQIYDIKLGFIR